MKTMHVLKRGLMVLGASAILALVPAHAQNKVPVPSADPVSAQTAPVGPAGNAGGLVKQGPPPGPTNAPKEDIRDIRGLREIPDPWRWALYAAGGLLGLLLLYGLWRVLRRKKLRLELAHERAFAALERARELMQPDQARAFSFQLSDVIRQYIEARFAVRTTQQTTSEFLVHMSEQGSGPLSGQRGLLHEFLENCDRVKFARAGLTESEMEGMYQSAWQFVDATKPTPEESPKAGPRFRVPVLRRGAGGPNTEHRTPNSGPNLMVGGVS